MRRLLSILVLPFVSIDPATAHHAFAADYEAGNEGELEGIITEVIYNNPHARYYLEVTNEDGEKELWDLQTMNLMMLGRVGWKKDTLKVGDKVKVEGILGRNNTKRMSINVVTFDDGREFPDTATSSSLGFSQGEWKGETLVVTTTRLNPAFMSTRGQPVSADAYTVEHFYFDDKGYLHGDMWLHDPKNYRCTPYLRRVYDRDFSPSVITKVDCDPFTFFRALYLEGELETFWERAPFRR